jgi:hypothetical protein
MVSIVFVRVVVSVWDELESAVKYRLRLQTPQKEGADLGVTTSDSSSCHWSSREQRMSLMN